MGKEGGGGEGRGVKRKEGVQHGPVPCWLQESPVVAFLVAGLEAMVWCM